MIGNKYSVVAAMQLMEYAPNSPSIQKRFGTAILHGNKMFPSLEYDWMEIVHTPPYYLPISPSIQKRFGCFVLFVNSYLMGIETFLIILLELKTWSWTETAFQSCFKSKTTITTLIK